MAGQMHVRPAASAMVPSPAGLRGQAPGQETASRRGAKRPTRSAS
jgi:hypothetical protein